VWEQSVVVGASNLSIPTPTIPNQLLIDPAAVHLHSSRWAAASIPVALLSFWQFTSLMYVGDWLSGKKMHNDLGYY
jgi:hypothetical protein